MDRLEWGVTSLSSNTFNETFAIADIVHNYD